MYSYILIGILCVRPVLHTQGTSQYIICPILFCFLWYWQFSCIIWFYVSAETFLVLHMVVGVFIWCCFLVFVYYLRNQCRCITISSILCCGKLKYMYWKSCNCNHYVMKLDIFLMKKLPAFVLWAGGKRNTKQSQSLSSAIFNKLLSGGCIT